MSREAFFPPVRLLRGMTSTKRLYFSASTSSQFGQRSQLGLYIEPYSCDADRSFEIEVMVYLESPPQDRDNYKICEMRLYKESSEKYRYIEVSGEKTRCVGDVYFPKGMFSGKAPEICWLEIDTSPDPLKEPL